MVKFRKVFVFILVFSIMATCLFVPTQTNAALEFPNPIAWYKFDGNGNDSSGNGNNATAVSPTNSGITYVTGVDGKGAKFDGASYFEVPDKDSLDLGNNYSFSVWIYKEDIRPKRYQPIIEKRGAGEFEDQLAYALADSEDMETYVKFFGENDQGDQAYSTTYLDFHKWQLLTVTSDGQYMKFYIDGVLQANKQAVSQATQSTGPLLIGNSEWDDGSFFKGVMDDLMIFNVTLTPAQIKNYYTRVATGTGKPLLDMGRKLVAQYKFEDNFKDASGNNNNGPATQVQGISFVQGKIGKAAKFDGSAFFQVPDSDLLDLGNNFSFTLWLCKDPNESNDGYPILNKAKSSVGEGIEPGYALLEYDGDMRVSLMDENRQGLPVYIEDPMQPTKWHHLAVTCENGLVKFYYDGVLKATKPTKGFVTHSSGNLFVGWNEWGNVNFFKGTMDDLRLYNYALSATEVKNIAAATDKLAATPSKADALKVNASTQLKVTLTSLETKKVADVTAAAVYTTSNAKVVKVVKGKITGVAKGKANIIVNYGPHSVTVPITVK